jgi:hypothetical protein
MLSPRSKRGCGETMRQRRVYGGAPLSASAEPFQPGGMREQILPLIEQVTAMDSATAHFAGRIRQLLNEL